MKLTYGNCQRSILESLMKNGHSSDEAMAIWNATKLNRFDKDEAQNCDSGPVAANAVTYTLSPLEIEQQRTRELSEILADLRADAREKETAFHAVLSREKEAFEGVLMDIRGRVDYLHNRRITLESVLKSVRRLTSDPEITNIIRLALTGFDQRTMSE